MRCRDWFRAVGVVVLVGSGGSILAQNPPSNPALTRTTLAQGDLSVPGRETVVMRVGFPPGATAGWHTHPGEEISYVTQGQIMLMIAGQPPRKVSAGEALIVPAGAVHNARNDGTSPAELLVVYVVEKGKPLRTPAPEPAH
jgi:quercetin dioxygenase-like cupin family protein